MLMIDYMDVFISRSSDVEQALLEARRDVNEVELPEGIGPLRLSLHEVMNILESVVEFVETAPDPADSSQQVQFKKQLREGIDEIADQLYLHQFSPTLAEVREGFHKDLVKVILHNPMLMAVLSPIVRLLKGQTVTRLEVSKKFTMVSDATSAVLETLDEANTPDYVFRVLDEIVDFSECMILARPSSETQRPTADNDNVGVAAP